MATYSFLWRITGSNPPPKKLKEEVNPAPKEVGPIKEESKPKQSSFHEISLEEPKQKHKCTII